MGKQKEEQGSRRGPSCALRALAAGPWPPALHPGPPSRGHGPWGFTSHFFCEVPKEGSSPRAVTPLHAGELGSPRPPRAGPGLLKNLVTLWAWPAVPFRRPPFDGWTSCCAQREKAMDVHDLEDSQKPELMVPGACAIPGPEAAMEGPGAVCRPIWLRDTRPGPGLRTLCPCGVTCFLPGESGIKGLCLPSFCPWDGSCHRESCRGEPGWPGALANWAVGP